MENSLEFLQKVSREFIRDTFFVPVIGAEIEFYLRGSFEESSIMQKISQKCEDEGLTIYHFDPEEGVGQFEISLAADANAQNIANSIIKIPEIVEEIAYKNDARASFSAKPYENEAGNSLQIHVSLLNKKFANVFEKKSEDETQTMLYAIGGLLDAMPNDMKHFVPTQEGARRLLEDKYAPKTISWGGNNRTVALRLPACTADPHNRRIEHRIPSADSDPHMVIALILQAIKNGIVNKTTPSSEKIYGDASLEMYNLPKISTHL